MQIYRMTFLLCEVFSSKMLGLTSVKKNPPHFIRIITIDIEIKEYIEEKKIAHCGTVPNAKIHIL